MREMQFIIDLAVLDPDLHWHSAKATLRLHDQFSLQAEDSDASDDSEDEEKEEEPPSNKVRVPKHRLVHVGELDFLEFDHVHGKDPQKINLESRVPAKLKLVGCF